MREHVLPLRHLVERARYRPVIDRRYPLDDVIAATRYAKTGQKTGNVVLIVGGEDAREGAEASSAGSG